MKAPRTNNRLLHWLYLKRGRVVFAAVIAVLGIIFIVRSLAATNPNLLGDLNNDNIVNLTDLSLLLSNYNKSGDAADLNGDNTTNLTDLSLLLSNYNKTYSGGPNPTPPTPTPPTPTPPTPPAGSNRSIRGQQLYVYNPSDWAGRPQEIYGNQVGKWFGDWVKTINIRGAVDAVVGGAPTGQLPLVVAYAVPGKDCGGYSSGTFSGSAQYRAWLDEFIAGVGNRKAIVILEPDALAQMDDCLTAGDQELRIADIAYAVTALKEKTQASVYIDGGNTGWRDAATMADRLKRANVANATGFSVNVSNFKFTADTVAYGEQVVSALQGLGVSGARYVVDTSRNGKGPADPSDPEAWCNPAGRGLGKKPTTNPDSGANNDAFLWIKTIGESDGTCKGGPDAGMWYPEYAQMLIDNAVY